MSRLKLSLACIPYDRVQPLMSGEVQIEGVELTSLPLRFPTEIFSRMIANAEFDIAEMSITHAFVLQQRGEARFVTLPIFPSRMFRHGFIFYNEKSGIKTPKDLENKRIGVQGHQTTAAIWIRGILQREYGVSFAGVKWFEGGVNQKGLIGGHITQLRPDEKIDVSHIGQQRTLSDMLGAGELDALIGPEIPGCFFNVPDVKRLFPDYHRIEREYYQKTKVFPIMHGLVIREDLYRQNPWLATSIYKGFEQSKRLAQRQARFTGAMSYMLPWMFEQLEEVDEVFGPDPWPYGIEHNRPTLNAYLEILLQQRYLREMPRLEDMFVPTQE